MTQLDLFADPQSTAADPKISAFVTANAGSGKTYTLVSRVARLLLAKVRPEKILCLTYTKAAAAEMQRRLFERLGGWSVAPDSDLRRELGTLLDRSTNSFSEDEISTARRLFAQALETPGGLKIQTIHAFCERLLRRFPLEAGVAPAFKVIDDAVASTLAAEARDQVALATQTNDAVAEAYARFAVALSFPSWEEMFRTFEVKREAIARHMLETGGAQAVLDHALRACGLTCVEDAGDIERAAVLPPALSLGGWRQAAMDLGASGGVADAKAAILAGAIADGASLGEARVDEMRRLFFTKDKNQLKSGSVASRKVDPRTVEFLAGEKARVDEAFERARANRIVNDTVQALVLAGVYTDAYERAKSRRGVLDFADLVARARDLMVQREDAAWVLFKMDGGIDHVLIDEAQDTAPEQWEILRALTGEFFAGAGKVERWIDPTVFAVGDEKQSIFSFQGARPEVLFQEIGYYRGQTEQAGRAFRSVDLLVSRRSTPEVLTVVDAVFEPAGLVQAVMAGRPRLDGANDNLVLRHLPHRKGQPGCVDMLWPLEQEDSADDLRAWDEPVDAGERRGAWRRLAEKIADEIVRLVADGDQVHDRDTDRLRPAHFGDVLILVRQRGALFKEMIRALKRRGAPVAGADRLALAETAVFEDVLALVRFCLYPDDDLTLAGVLRSPFCDVDEAGLYDLCRGRPYSLWQALRDRRDERSEFASAAAMLEALRAQSTQRTPFDFLARLCDHPDTEGRSMRTRLRTRLGPEAEDALDETLTQLLNLEGQGVRDLEGVAHAMAGLAVTVKRDMDEGRGEVRVMTAHGAKGLEAPIVFLPETVAAQTGRDSALLELRDGGFLWCVRTADDCKASRLARERRKEANEAEGQRLLYVALTRARDRLVLAGRLQARRNPDNVSGWWRSVLDAFGGETLAPGVREVRSGNLTLRRFGPDPLQAPQIRLTSPQPAPEPGWLRTRAPAAPALRYASPSQALDDEPPEAAAISPLARTAGLGRFRRGEIIHRLLQLLPDIPEGDRAAACDTLLAQEADLSRAQRDDMAAAAFKVLDDPVFAPVFGPGSRAESALAGTSKRLPAGLSVSGRMDRLVVAEGRVLVVDYKTNRPAPEIIEDTDPAYITQMAIYVAVLEEIFPGRKVEAALVWTDGPKLMPVPENMITQALAGLGPAA